MANRKKIGIANGIAGVGTAEGNTQMLNLLKSGKLKKYKIPKNLNNYNLFEIMQREISGRIF